MFKVCSKQCDQCLFSKKKIVADDRKKEILKGCVKGQKHFICHKTDNVCCRGFYDAMGDASQMIRIAERLDCIEFVDVEKKPLYSK